MEKISIVVPIYNAKKTINRCIDSLINQTYKNIEIILVNDGSTDESLEICKNYANYDPRIIVIDKSNSGVSSARNEGINVSTGKYIMFCDSDDYVCNNWCEKLYESHQEGYLVMCGYSVLDKFGNLKKIQHKSINNVINKNEVMKLENCGFFSPVNKIYDNSIIKKNDIYFDYTIGFGEDLLFNLDYLKYISNGVLIVKQSLYIYDISNDESLSKKITVDLIDQIYYFYGKVKILMTKIGIIDTTQMKIIHVHVYNDIERYIHGVIFSNSIKYHKKISIINKVLKNNIYRECINDVKFTNLIYKFCSYRKEGIFLFCFCKFRHFTKKLAILLK